MSCGKGRQGQSHLTGCRFGQPSLCHPNPCTPPTSAFILPLQPKSPLLLYCLTIALGHRREVKAITGSQDQKPSLVPTACAWVRRSPGCITPTREDPSPASLWDQVCSPTQLSASNSSQVCRVYLAAKFRRSPIPPLGSQRGSASHSPAAGMPLSRGTGDCPDPAMARSWDTGG